MDVHESELNEQFEQRYYYRTMSLLRVKNQFSFVFFNLFSVLNNVLSVRRERILLHLYRKEDCFWYIHFAFIPFILLLFRSHIGSHIGIYIVTHTLIQKMKKKKWNKNVVLFTISEWRCMYTSIPLCYIVIIYKYVLCSTLNFNVYLYEQ